MKPHSIWSAYRRTPHVHKQQPTQSKQQRLMPVVSEPKTLKHKNPRKGRQHEASLHLIGIHKNSSCAQNNNPTPNQCKLEHPSLLQPSRSSRAEELPPPPAQLLAAASEEDPTEIREDKNYLKEILSNWKAVVESTPVESKVSTCIRLCDREYSTRSLHQTQQLFHVPISRRRVYIFLLPIFFLFFCLQQQPIFLLLVLVLVLVLQQSLCHYLYFRRHSRQIHNNNNNNGSKEKQARRERVDECTTTKTNKLSVSQWKSKSTIRVFRV